MSKNNTMLEQIKEYCSKNGITGYELAKHLPLTQVALQGILTGTTAQPRVKNVKMIYDFLFKNENTINEQSTVYETGFDRKISETKKEIEKLKEEITKWENKIVQDPAKEVTYEKYRSSYEEQIFLLNEIINITLEAKKDFLENND